MKFVIATNNPAKVREIRACSHYASGTSFWPDFRHSSLVVPSALSKCASSQPPRLAKIRRKNLPASVVGTGPKAMFEGAGIEFLSLADFGLALCPNETGATFEENAVIKASETAALLRENGHKDVLVLADDSGLEIDALGGKPGVDSALYLGAETPYAVRNAHILEELRGISGEEDGADLARSAVAARKGRSAVAAREGRFVCVMACSLPDGGIVTVRAELRGEIAEEIRGENGFGYDPIFFLPAYGKTMAELSGEEKNKISHRGQAFRKMMEKLRYI